MAGYLYRLVQRGLGRTRTVQPLYTARYARDAAPAALPAVSAQREARVYRQADANSNEEDESAGGADLARSPDADTPENEDEGQAGAPLVQSKALNVQRRAARPFMDIQRQSDADGEEADEAAGAGDGGGDPGGTDAGLAGDAGEQPGIPEDEDLAPGRDGDTLSPKIHRRSISNAISQPRIFRQSESEEGEAADAGDSGAADAGPQSEDESVQTSRESLTVSRRAAGPQASPAMPAPSRNGARQVDGSPKASVSGPEASNEAVFSESVNELLMPAEPTVGQLPAAPEATRARGDAEIGRPKRTVAGAQGDGENGSDAVSGVASPARYTPESLSGVRTPASPPAPGRREEAPAGPEIQISIGRIEIRAVGDDQESSAASAASYPAESGGAGQMQSLQDYLKRRNGEVQ